MSEIRRINNNNHMTNKSKDEQAQGRTDLGMSMVSTRHNLADSVPTSDLVCIKEVTIRTIFIHMITGITYYTCRLVIDIQCTRYENVFNVYKCF